jgi:DMSO reductase anchor subunit
MAVAASLSFFHLHRPMRAYRALSNLRASWLSREVFFEVAFAGLVAVLGVCVRFGIGDAAVVKGLFVCCGLAGILFVASMARLYMLPSMQAWNGIHTPISFFLTSLLTGTLASLVFFRVGGLAGGRYLRALPAICLGLLAASFITAMLLSPQHGLFRARPGPSLRPPGRRFAGLHVARLACLLAGAAVLVAAGPGGRVAGAAALVAFLMVFAAEIFGRIVFYGAALD